MKLGMKMKKRRKRLGLSQWQVAKRMGVARSTVANFENGHRRVRSLFYPSIRQALKLSRGEFSQRVW